MASKLYITIYNKLLKPKPIYVCYVLEPARHLSILYVKVAKQWVNRYRYHLSELTPK